MESNSLETEQFKPEKPCYPELAAILMAGAGHVITELAVSHAAAQVYNGAVVIGFGVYLAIRASRGRDVFRVWGMRRDNFLPALRAQLAFALPAGVVVYV